MITHEEARNKVKSNHNKFYTEGEFTKDMLDYINQQEKKDKLLELYRKQQECIVCMPLFEGSRLLSCEVEHNEKEKYMQLRETIKQKEKELGEMK